MGVDNFMLSSIIKLNGHRWVNSANRGIMGRTKCLISVFDLGFVVFEKHLFLVLVKSSL